MLNRFDVQARGYAPIYRAGETNHCPGCGRSHWYVGRISAECCFCGTALPLRECSTGRAGTMRRERVRSHELAA